MRLRTTTTLLLALAAGLASGCGSDEEGSPIPGDQAAALDNQLASIQSRFEAAGGACGDITGGADPNTRAVEQIIDSLPGDVDADVRDALEQGFQNLFELTNEQCDEQEGEQTETTEEPPPVTDTETTTETVPTAPEPTETEEQPPVETDPDEGLPPGQGGEPPGQGGENPGQGGGGGAVVPEEDG